MIIRSIRSYRWLIIAGLLVTCFLIACAPPQSSTPQPTAATILQITVAPTQNIDATATTYARQLIPTPTPAGLYVVQPGDTLGGIAQEFGTTVEELLAANGMTDPKALQAGQTLLIPSLISGTLSLGTAELPLSTAMGTTTAVLRSPTPTLTSPCKGRYQSKV